jgi:hypothetical protein
MIPQLILIAVIAIGAAGAGGGAIWALKKNAVDACNAHWQADIAEANRKILLANQEKQDEVDKAQETARLEMERVAKELEDHKQIIAEALAHIPLSEACNKCTIPESLIWGMRVRAGANGGRGPAVHRTESEPGVAHPRSEAGVSEKEARKGIFRPRAFGRPGLRGGAEKTD